jgi:hypothetical protein
MFLQWKSHIGFPVKLNEKTWTLQYVIDEVKNAIAIVRHKKTLFILVLRLGKISLCFNILKEFKSTSFKYQICHWS